MSSSFSFYCLAYVERNRVRCMHSAGPEEGQVRGGRPMPLLVACVYIFKKIE
jgi:hypothetical protein